MVFYDIARIEPRTYTMSYATLFSDAIKQEDNQMIDYLLNNSYVKPKELIYFACKQENIMMIEYLINNSYIKPTIIQELVYFACKHGMVDVLNLLLLKGVDLEKSNNSGWKAIHIAVRYGHVKIVELLAMNGVDLESVTRYTYTPIQIAASFGQTEIFKILLYRILNSFVKREFPDSIANVTFKEKGAFRPFEIIVNHQGKGTEISILDSRNSSYDIINRIANKIVDLLWKDTARHITALSLSCEKNNLDILEIILQFMTMNIFSIDHKVLCEPLSCICKNDRLDALALFIMFGLLTTSELNSLDPEGIELINLACISNSINIVKLYIDMTDKQQIEFNSDTIFGICEKNRYNIFRLIMDYINLEVTDRYGNDLIFYCCLNNSLEIFEMLIDLLDLERRDMYQNTPLHNASEFGRLSIVKLLVNSGVDINAKNSDGLCPLHYACKQGHLDIAKYLYENGAYIHSLDNALRRPIDYACEFDHVEIVRLFVDGFVSEKIYGINPITNPESLNMLVVMQKENVYLYLIPRIEVYKRTIFVRKINKYFDIDIQTVA